ncbi:MAG: TonB-dependent receptor, partial [Luteimonas sp.]|nr:TonB-dependent receptor [Luteimonas sp.]
DGQDGSNFDPGSLLAYDPDNAPSYYETGRIGPETESTSARLSGEQELGSQDLMLSWGVGFTRQKNLEKWHPTIFDFNFLEDGYTTYVPYTNPYNTFGEDVMVGYSYQREFERITLSEQQKQDNLDYNIGLAGKLSWMDGWDYQLSYSGSSEKGRTDSLGDLTGSLGEDGYLRTQAVLDGLNVFGDGSNPAIVDANAALIQSLVERSVYTFDSRARSVDLLLRGDLFAMPAGKVQGAFGAQYRTEDYSFDSSLGDNHTESNRDARAVFGEVGIPLLKDVAFAKELTLTLAARHERFDQEGNGALQDGTYFAGGSLAEYGGFDIGAISGLPPPDTVGGYGAPQRVSRSYSNTSPLARLSWRPFAGLRLRGTWGKSFLTPQAQQQFGILYLDDRTFLAQYNGAELPAGIDHLIALRGPNNDLKPQVATVKTLGFDWSPGFAPGLTLSSTYNDTRFENYIGDPLSGISYPDVFADLSQFPAGTFTTGENGVLLWDARDINFLGRRSRSIDTSASYFLGSSLGDFRFELNTVRTLELSSQTLASQPEVVFSDSELGPSKWAADLLASWEDGNYFATLASHYSAAHRVTKPLSAQGTIYNDFIPNENPRTHSGSYTTWDAQLGYRTLGSTGWSRGLTVRLGVQNLFNREFPFVDNLYGFVTNRVDVRGRVIYLDIKKEF